MSSPIENVSCGWQGPLPEFMQTGLCQQCKRECSAGEVVRCRLGLLPEPPKDTKPEVKQSIKGDPTPRSVRKRVESGIGDCLKQYFDKIGAKQQEGCSCEDIRLQLNKRTSEQVLQEIENWLDSVMSNVKYLKGVKGTLIKAANLLLPNTLRSEVKAELLKCMEESKARLSQIDQDAPRIDPE